MKTITCCFSGHRPAKLPWGKDETDERCLRLKAWIAEKAILLYKQGYRHYICGMAMGSDMYFCEELIRLRDFENYDITIEAAIPCEQQSNSWSQSDRERYFRLVGACDTETLVQRHYSRDCMMKRNRYMVDKSSCIVCVYDGRLSGTMHTLLYAVRRGLEVIEIDPNQI